VVNPPLSRREKFALLGVAVLFVGWFFLPVIRQPQEYHNFADARSWLGIPRAADVLSNLPFIALGLLGLWRLRQHRLQLSRVVTAGMCIIFVGFFFTGFGSAYYHWEPNDARLVWDRLPMTIAFSGVFGALFALRVSERSGALMLVLMLIVGPASVFYWRATGDLSMYGEVQFGALAVLLALLLLTKNPDDPFPWWILLAWYVAAKILEDADAKIWALTGGIVAGHALKHLAAAAGGWALARSFRGGQPKTESP
jgi:Ceramidase